MLFDFVEVARFLDGPDAHEWPSGGGKVLDKHGFSLCFGLIFTFAGREHLEECGFVLVVEDYGMGEDIVSNLIHERTLSARGC